MRRPKVQSKAKIFFNIIYSEKTNIICKIIDDSVETYGRCVTRWINCNQFIGARRNSM